MILQANDFNVLFPTRSYFYYAFKIQKLKQLITLIVKSVKSLPSMKMILGNYFLSYFSQSSQFLKSKPVRSLHCAPQQNYNFF